MKKIIAILFLLSLVCPAMAQAPDKVAINYTLSATGAAATIPGTYLYHAFSVNVIGGTLSECNIDLEGSDDATNWSNVIAAHDCSTKGVATTTYGLYKYFRPYINTYTVGTGTPVLEYVYYGYMTTPSSIEISNLTTDTAVGYAPTENPIGTGGLYQATQAAVDTGDRTAIQTDAYGNLLTVSRASATEGCTPYSLIGAATANLTAITDGPTTICGGVITNINAAVMYVKFYNKATAPDPSACSSNSDCPVLRFAIPGDTTGAGVTIPISSLGINFTTGLGMSITTGIADTDETAVAANEVIVNLWYKH